MHIRKSRIEHHKPKAYQSNRIEYIEQNNHTKIMNNILYLSSIHTIRYQVNNDLVSVYIRGLQRFQAKDPLVEREMKQGPPQPVHRFHIVSLFDSTIISVFWIHVNLCFQIFNHLNRQYLINLTFHSVLSLLFFPSTPNLFAKNSRSTSL